MFDYVVLMAAGCGRRLNELTIEWPKALVNVKGIPLLAYSLTQINHRINSIFITVGHQKHKMIQFWGGNKGYHIIDTSGKGNSWWIFNSPLKYVNEPILVLACDLITMLDLSFIYSNYIRIGSPPCMIIPVKPVEGIEGDYIDEKNKMVLSLSRTRFTSSYSSGIQVINPFTINKEFKEYDDFNQLWLELIHKKMLFVSDLYPHSWFSINTKEQLNTYYAKHL